MKKKSIESGQNRNSSHWHTIEWKFLLLYESQFIIGELLANNGLFSYYWVFFPPALINSQVRVDAHSQYKPIWLKLSSEIKSLRKTQLNYIHLKSALARIRKLKIVAQEVNQFFLLENNELHWKIEEKIENVLIKMENANAFHLNSELWIILLDFFLFMTSDANWNGFIG